LVGGKVPLKINEDGLGVSYRAVLLQLGYDGFTRYSDRVYPYYDVLEEEMIVKSF